MSREEIFTALNEIFCEVLGLDSVTLKDTTTAADIDEWDSISHISLINAVQRQFKIKFSVDEVVSSMKNVGQLVDRILEKTA